MTGNVAEFDSASAPSLDGGAAADRLGVRQMPSAYHGSFMHEEDGAGKYPVPLEKRS